MSREPALPYTPFIVPHRLAMGIAPLRADDPWLELDGELAHDLREKRRLLAGRHTDVYVELPESLPAQREVLESFAAYLPTHHPDAYALDGRHLTVRGLNETYDLDHPAMSPLDLAGRLVQEDLCLMQRRDDAWRLTAGSVCFPTRWSLRSKLGRSLSALHDPVPGFQQQLARSADQFFDRMKADRPVWRANWSLTDDPSLFQPSGHERIGPNPDITSENAGDTVWLRVERQTLRRLPQTDAILFTIRIHQHRLRALAADHEAAVALSGALQTMPVDLGEYKSLPVLRDAVLAYLHRVTRDTES